MTEHQKQWFDFFDARLTKDSTQLQVIQRSHARAAKLGRFEATKNLPVALRNGLKLNFFCSR
jgi:hypothetical protein